MNSDWVFPVTNNKGRSTVQASDWLDWHSQMGRVGCERSWTLQPHGVSEGLYPKTQKTAQPPVSLWLSPSFVSQLLRGLWSSRKRYLSNVNQIPGGGCYSSASILQLTEEKCSLKRKKTQQTQNQTTSDLITLKINYSLPNLYCETINYKEIWQILIHCAVASNSVLWHAARTRSVWMEDGLIICDKVHFGKIVVVFSFPNDFFFLFWLMC